MVKEAIILAGGLGTRLKNVIHNIPKPMAPINNKPFLEYQLNYLKSYGIRQVVISVGYKKEIIIGYFRNRFNDIEIVYSIENKPLGTGGGIKKALKQISENSVFVLNGDTMCTVNLKELFSFHVKKKSSLTITLKQLEDNVRYGNVEIDDDNRIVEYSENKSSSDGYINSGVYLVNRNVFNSLKLPNVFSIETDCFAKFYKTKNFFGFIYSGLFIDIGIPEDYYRAQKELNEP